MFSYGFSVNEATAVAETISINTQNVSAATVLLSKNSGGPFTAVPGVTIVLNPGSITINITAAAATSTNFPTYYIVCFDGTEMLEGVIRFNAAPAPTGGGGSDGPHTHAESDVINLPTHLSGKVDSTDPRLSDSRTPTTHTHAETDVTNLSTALGGKVDSTDARLSDSRTPVAHSHGQVDVTGLSTTLSGKVDSTDTRLTNARTPTAHQHPAADLSSLPTHTHAETDVTNLNTALGGKVDTTDTRLTDARTPTTHSHASTDVNVTTSGLSVVTHTGLQAAITDLDGWASGRPTHESGTLATLPANGARNNGSTYLATDQNGGTTYRMVSGAWVQEAAAVNQAKGMIAGPVQLTSSFDVKAVGVTVADVTGMSINVPASSSPVLLRTVLEIQSNSGTAAAGSSVRIQALITDNANNVLSVGTVTFVQVTAAAVVFAGQITLERYLPAPVAANTYKIRALLLSAIPANWTSAFILPNNSTGTTPADNFYALAV